MMKKMIAAVALAAMTMSAQAGVVVSEGFENVPALAASGWTFTNNGTPGGISSGWIQGTNTPFPAQAGGIDSFAAAAFFSAGLGGMLDTWLITPVFDATNGVDISFYLRAGDDPAYSDSLAYGFTGAAAAMTVVSAVPTDGWTLYNVHLDANLMGSTSFAFRYFGAVDTSDYVGLDTLTVTELPEPAGIALFAAGLLGLGALRRRNRG